MTTNVFNGEDRREWAFGTSRFLWMPIFVRVRNGAGIHLLSPGSKEEKSCVHLKASLSTLESTTSLKCLSKRTNAVNLSGKRGQWRIFLTGAEK